MFVRFICFPIFILVLISVAPGALSADPGVTFQDPKAPLAARVNDLFSKLTQSEKLSMLTGTTFTSQPLPRLGLKGMQFADAGQGVRGGGGDNDPVGGPSTAFPAGVSMSSSWDQELEREVGKAIGEEARNKGTGVQIELGPAVNIHRSPLCGRDSEYMSEDPYFNARMAVQYIEGMQSTGTLACIKHFACNNEEVDRANVNVIVDERTLREIYLPAFEAAVKEAHVGAIMAAYNKVNGSWCTANWYLLTNVLRNDWGFDGLVMSDWGATHSIGQVVTAGTDLEMPGPGLLSAANLSKGLDDGTIPKSAIDHAVKNILRAAIRAGLADSVQPMPDNSVVGSAEHQAIALRAGEEGMVLLKNDSNLLPLNPSDKMTIALIGPRVKSWQFNSWGSTGVHPTVQVNAFDGITQRLAANPHAAILYDSAAVNGNGFQNAVNIAKQADVAIVMVGGEPEEEGNDRSTMNLIDDGDELVKEVAAANPHTVVVLNNGAPILVHKWIGSVQAVLEAGFPGELGGKALAAVLFGDFDPSGKLVDTYGVRREDYPDYGNFPGVNNVVHYSEGIYVGYRAFDKRAIRPEFPFGYGLSYTSFKYSSIHLSSMNWAPSRMLTVTAKITNTGKRAGAEVAELYLEPKTPKIDRPIRELHGFARVDLAPSETKTVSFTLTPRDFAYCDVLRKEWKADAGEYAVDVGASSHDLRLKARVLLTSSWTESIPGMGARDPFAPPPSLTTGKAATASSEKAGNLAAYAIDDDSYTRWESEWSDPQWFEVDLGAPATFSKVLLSWETAYGKAYRLQTSNDNETWTTVYSTTAGVGRYETLKFSAVKARYVRLFVTQRGTEYGDSLYSFDVYPK